MTQRDAVDVAADALMDSVAGDGRELFGPNWRKFEAECKLRDAIAKALRSASISGAEAMRESAPASPWRDMESAPKTGERILLKVRPRAHLGDETEQVAVGHWLDNSGTKMPWQGWSTDLAVCPRAFGWMPLPSAALPTPSTKDEQT